MGFAGNLRTLSLVEVFQTLNRIQATGILRLASPTGGRDLVFDKGAMIGVAFRSGEQKQALLRRLVLRGKLDANAAASLSSTGGESQLVKALVTKGWVSADDVSAAYQHQAEDELASMCTWEYADFVFEDAGPDQPLANELLERYRKQPLQRSMNHILMEAARRLDDWNRLRTVIPDPSVVFAPTAAGEQGLREIGAEYPGSAVSPLVDGVRSVEDVAAESVATRLDVYQVFGEMIERKLIDLLTEDDLLAKADSLSLANQHARAAHLYRRLLRSRPDDSDLGAKLASCLDHLGDSKEAAASYAQLSLQHLARSEGDQAMSFGRRAVELSPNDPALRLTLVRYLLWAKDADAAVAELKVTVQLYLDLGQLEEARSTCLKILDIQPHDDDARRHLARIFSKVEKDPAAEDVVVCIQCNQVNDRESKVCKKCRSPLQLTCLSCNRVVGVSDRLCIFCGADPHGGVANRQAPGRPGTSTYIKTDRVSAELKQKGTEFWRGKLSAVAESARTKEKAGNFEEALADWRELAQSQTDNAELQAHIRELERRAGENHIERQIELGHRYRHGRAFWRAAKAYRGALRAMPTDDPRAGPLAQILKKTEANRRRNSTIFASAFVILAIVGLLVAKPYRDLRNFRVSVQQTRTEIDGIAAQGAQGVPAVDAEITELAKRAEAFQRAQARPARLLVDELEGALRLAKQGAADQELRAIVSAIDAQDLAQAKTRLASFERAFGSEYLQIRVHQQAERLKRLQLEAADRERLVKEGPQLLERAAKHERDGQLATALADFRALGAATDAKVTAEAAKGAQRLEAAQADFLQRLQDAKELSASDLVAGAAAYKGLEAQAASWGLVDRVAEERRSVDQRMRSATEAFAALTDRATLAELEAFVADHPGAAEIPQAKLRVATVRKDQNLIQQDIARYRSLMDAQHYEDAWKSAHDLIAVHGKSLRSDEVAFPLVIETAPAGASVALDGRVIGKTPFVLTCLPQSDGEVTLVSPGWNTVTFRTREADKRWLIQTSLVRTARWQVKVAGTVSELLPTPDGGCMVGAGTALTALDRDGHATWTRSFTSDDLGDGHPRFRHAPVLLPDGAWAIGLPVSGFAILDGASGSGPVVATTSEVRGRPLVYTNDVFGTRTRVALAAEALFSGPPETALARLPLAAPALAGPVAITKDIDRILAVIDLRGHLVGVEESTKATAWDLDLQATEAGQLLQHQDQLAVILDGSRLVSCRIGSASAQLAWSQRLPPPVVGDPILSGSDVCIAAGDAIYRFGADGSRRDPLTLGAQPSSPASAAGDLLAVGCVDRAVRLFRGGKPLWSSPCPATITAVAVSAHAIYVGSSDGTVLVLEP